MLSASEQALIQAHRQLGILYQQVGIHLNSKTLWRKVGATPMIGQNDVADEVFTLEDAEELNKFAHENGVGRVSMWSINRDISCSENYVDTKVVSDSCSGVKGEKFSFSQALSKGFTGDLTQNATVVTSSDPEASTQKPDDPTKSPYQIWQEAGAYPKGVKVVWHGNVYEAKWWTKGDLPDNPVLQAWETPWQLVGPVLPGELPIEQPSLPAGTYPVWSGNAEYQGGERVLFEGVPFQAKWWNKGESPAASAANSDSSPWLPLTQEQIKAILEELKTSSTVKSSKTSNTTTSTATTSATTAKTTETKPSEKR
jgi:chitinase